MQTQPSYSYMASVPFIRINLPWGVRHLGRLVSFALIFSYKYWGSSSQVFTEEKKEQNERRKWVSHSSWSIMRRICEIYWFFFGTVNCAVDEAHWLLLKRWKSHLFKQTGLKHTHWIPGFQVMTQFSRLPWLFHPGLTYILRTCSL